MLAFSRKRLIASLVGLLLLLSTASAIYYFLRPAQTPQESAQKETPKFEAFWKQRIEAAMAPSNCPDTGQPKIPTTSYQGKLYDGHIHIPSIFTGGENDEPSYEDKVVNSTLGVNIKMSEFVCVLEHDGTSKAFAFFPVYREMSRQHIEIAKQTMERYPDRFVPYVMPPDNDGSKDGFPTVDADSLKKMLGADPGLFKGYGEIGLYARSGGSPALFPDSPRLTEIYPVVRKNKLLIYFHLGEGMRESYKKIIKANPDINFLFHGDQLIQCEKCSQDLSQIEDVLGSAPNVYYEVDELWGDVFIFQPEVTKKQFFNHFKDYKPLLKKDVATWKGFIEKFPDQVIWGSDRGIFRWPVDLEVSRQLTDYVRAFIARLDPTVQEKYAYKNIEKLLPN
ncbi:MAG: amidohydrolase family protein [bacterium]|nr:amidohydrolase family protein [bacterium]